VYIGLDEHLGTLMLHSLGSTAIYASKNYY
jgi:hypothetical protein